jgi:hypothetical protein
MEGLMRLMPEIRLSMLPDIPLAAGLSGEHTERNRDERPSKADQLRAYEALRDAQSNLGEGVKA